MNALTREFTAYYHTERPDPSKENEVLTSPDKPKAKPAAKKKPKAEKALESEPPWLIEIACRQRLGGLLKH